MADGRLSQSNQVADITKPFTRPPSKKFEGAGCGCRLAALPDDGVNRLRHAHLS